MVRPRKLLVVIADGEHARFIDLGDDGALRTGAELDSEQAHQRSSDIGSDPPGAAFHSGSTAHHAMTPRHDPHELAMAAFARQVADEINRRAAQAAFSELLIAAPPQTLNVIVPELGPEALDRLAGRLRKDLVNVPDHLLGPHFRAWVRAPRRSSQQGLSS